jgi:hypothetical protein
MWVSDCKRCFNCIDKITYVGLTVDFHMAEVCSCGILNWKVVRLQTNQPNWAAATVEPAGLCVDCRVRNPYMGERRAWSLCQTLRWKEASSPWLITLLRGGWLPQKEGGQMWPMNCCIFKTQAKCYCCMVRVAEPELVQAARSGRPHIWRKLGLSCHERSAAATWSADQTLESWIQVIKENPQCSSPHQVAFGGQYCKYWPLLIWSSEIHVAGRMRWWRVQPYYTVVLNILKT